MASRDVEQIYRLSELQEAMLVHRLQHEVHDAGYLQVEATLEGDLDASAFEAAWQATVARHPVLRSSVHWRELSHPVQVVARKVALDLERHDWRELSADERRRRLAELRREDRKRGLAIDRAPVMRLALLRFAERDHRLFWACHHILLDGWSSALVIAEVLDRYRAEIGGSARRDDAAPTFQELLAWRKARPRPDLEAAWHGIAPPEPTYATLGPWHGGPPAGKTLTRSLDGLAEDDLSRWARRRRSTAGTLLLGCWALLLHERTGSEVPTFGFTTSGRSSAFPGIESVVGMLANTLPLAVPIDASRPVGEWMETVADRQQRLLAVESVPLAEILRAAGTPLERPPFDSLVTIANYPAIDGASEAPHGLTATDFGSDVTSAYPLTLAVRPGAGIVLEAHYDERLLEATDVRALITRFESLLRSVVEDDTRPLGELLTAPPAAATTRETAESEDPPVERAPLEPARTASEAQLMRIWSTLLEVDEVGAEDSFFDLGGHSLLLAEMIDRVERVFGVELSPGVVFAQPTLRALAGRLDSQGADAGWRTLVPVREVEGRTPVHLIHGLGGEIDWVYGLARTLPRDQPVCALQAPAEPFSDLVEMAGSYLAEIRRHQATGPYRLGGYCIGGAIAFEIARQLQLEGERVEMLVLIDSVPRGYAHGEPAPRLVRLGRSARNFLSKGPAEMLSTAQRRLHTTRLRLGRRLHDGEASPIEIDEIMDMRRIPAIYHEAAFRHFRAIREYEPSPYAGDAWLLRTRDPRFSPDLGWGELVDGSLTVEEVPGHHSQVVKEPYLAEIGHRLTRAIEAADAAAPVPLEST